MNETACSVGGLEKQSEMATQSNRIEKALADADNTQCTLRDRLESVLRCEPSPEPPINTAQVEEQLTPLAGNLRVFACQIEELTRVYKSIFDRIEL